MWQWHQALRKTCDPSKPVLLINMDETSVAAFHGVQKGTVSKVPKDEQEPIQWASRQTRRTCFTHAAFICDNARVQKKLPQLILASNKVMNEQVYNAIVARAPPNVFVKRENSAWMTVELTNTLIRVLAFHISDELRTHEVILIMDAARIHVHRTIWLTCNRLGIKLMIVPARMTWLLQPADVHTFAIYKAHMRRCWQDMMAARDDGVLDLKDLFMIVFDTIENVLEGRCWKHAFKSTGYHTNLAQVSNYIMKKLAYETKPTLTDSPPQLEDLKHIWPKNSIVPHNLVLKPFREYPPDLALPAAPQLVALPPAPVAAAAASSSQPLARATPLGGATRTQQKKLNARSASQQASKWRKMNSSSPNRLQEDREAQGQAPSSSSRAEIPRTANSTNSQGQMLPWTLRSQSSSAKGPR